jgi:drug/metabolite transporter (DMT)-like permease
MSDTSSQSFTLKRLMIAAAPIAFVLLWSTGFLGAKYGMPHAEPFTFLAYRFAIATMLFALVLLVMRVKWPKDWQTWVHAWRLFGGGILRYR